MIAAILYVRSRHARSILNIQNPGEFSTTNSDKQKLNELRYWSMRGFDCSTVSGSRLGPLHFTGHGPLRSVHAPAAQLKIRCLLVCILPKADALDLAKYFEATSDEACAHHNIICVMFR